MRKTKSRQIATKSGKSIIWNFIHITVKFCLIYIYFLIRHSITLYAPRQVRNLNVYCQVANRSHFKALITSSCFIPPQCFFLKSLRCGSLEAFEVKDSCWSQPPEAAVTNQQKNYISSTLFSLLQFSLAMIKRI